MSVTSTTMAMALRVSAVFITAIVFSDTNGHSYLVDPPADWRIANPFHCRRSGPKEYPNDEFAGPCIARDLWFLSPRIPTTTWTRGSKARAAWNQNNHENGFMRLILVRTQDRMKFIAHSMGVFYVGCYSGEKAKSGKVCGTGSFDYEATFQVPSLPDGLYILGWAWFGGYGGKHGKYLYRFGDYYSCAQIQIQVMSPHYPSLKSSHREVLLGYHRYLHPSR